MCGLAGQFLFDENALVDPKRLVSMTNRIRHRGPEADGLWTDRNVGFSHVRLKLSDAMHGQQPMKSHRGTVLAYNGEIYNNAELRAELAIHDYPFSTTSDTEVLLAAYDVWGEAAWPRLNGMFAFALHDPVKQTVYLVRDRFGIKPLYYRAIPNGIEFGSEPASWMDEKDSASLISPDALFHFLRFSQTSHGANSLFDDLHSVEPGAEIRVTPKGLKSRLWWNPEFASTEFQEPEHHVSARLRHLLHLAVGRQIAADSHVGVFLSGGIDSAILLALQSQMQSRRVDSFTVTVEKDEDDLAASRIVATKWKTSHAELILSHDEFFRTAQELTRIRALPLSLPNEVLIFALSRMASQSVKAVLCGEGADELFGGYSHLMLRMTKYFSAARAMENGNRLPMSALKAELKDADTRSESRFFASCYSWFTSAELRDLLQPDYAVLYDEWEKRDVFEPAWKNAIGKDNGNRLLSVLQRVHLPHLLSRLDGATMAASIEGRVPFTDTAVADFASSLPFDMKYRTNDQSKWLLRKTFSDLLPAEIIGRPKKAFHASLDSIFHSDQGRKKIQALVDDPKLTLIFRSNAIPKIIEDANSTNNYLKVWLLFSLSTWMNRNMN